MEESMKISSLLRMIDIRIRMDLNARNEEFHLSSLQVRILVFLIQNSEGEVNPRDLEHYFHISKPTVTGVLKRLEEKKYLHFEPSAKDHRYKQIVLDDKAFQCGKQLECNFKAMEERHYQGLSEQELSLTRSILLRLLNNISKEEEVIR